MTKPVGGFDKETYSLAKRVMRNSSNLTKEDLIVLEHLSNKGLYDEKQAYLGHSYESGDMQKLLQKIADHVPFVDEVEEFNELMGKGWQNRTKEVIDWKDPQFKKDAQFVVDFIQEELDELKMSIDQENMVGVLDAILDITYVSLGNGAMVFGLKDKIEAGYAEVQASNLSKICKTEEEAIETALVRSKEKGFECIYRKVGNGYVVYRASDDKVMKSINYFSPNLKQFFDKK